MTKRISIKGKRWSYKLVSDSRYEKLHGTDSDAITDKTGRYMHFKKSAFTANCVIHELFHAYCSSLHLDSADVTAGQFEEIIAEMLGEYIFEFMQKAEVMFNHMRKELVDEWKKVRRKKADDGFATTRSLDRDSESSDLRSREVRQRKLGKRP